MHHRRSIRLNGYDYTQAGYYFVTICTQNRHPLFGTIVNGRMALNDAGHKGQGSALSLKPLPASSDVTGFICFFGEPSNIGICVLEFALYFCLLFDSKKYIVISSCGFISDKQIEGVLLGFAEMSLYFFEKSCETEMALVAP